MGSFSGEFMQPEVRIVGAGPSGLMAAEVLATAGARVTIIDHMAAPARKFLLAGRGGLNLTHSDPSNSFSNAMAMRGLCSNPPSGPFRPTP